MLLSSDHFDEDGGESVSDFTLYESLCMLAWILFIVRPTFDQSNSRVALVGFFFFPIIVLLCFLNAHTAAAEMLVKLSRKVKFTCLAIIYSDFYV